jgi:glycosyltransferase involved in cell wall biosynthesis
MQINYFSPLLPAQSGISEVAEQVVPALARYADVTVWTDQTTWSPALASDAKVCIYDPEQLPWPALAQADVNVYHMGNNVDYHHHIWRISQRLPGIVVIHDVKLHHLFCGIVYVAQQNSEGYIDQIAQRYGVEAGLTARRFVSGELPITAVEGYSMTEWALSQAIGVIVHTRTAFTELAALDRWPIGYQPLPFHTPPRLPRNRPVMSPPYRLIIFGYIAHNRRVEAVLTALSQLPERSQFKLDIYGKLDDAAQIQAQIQTLGLEAQVTIHGFVEEAQLDRALANADLAINLRYPTMGEASISQLRIWRHALPALVTQVGWYAEQPEDVVCFIRPDREVADIQDCLQQLIQQPDRFALMGERGRQLLETDHAPDAYAQAIVDFATQLQSGRQHLNTQYWLERSAAIIASWQTHELGDRELDRVTQAISWLSQTTAAAGDVKSV